MTGPVLVVGFGDFPGVVNNPAAQLARAVHGWPGSPAIVGAVMPVSYRRGLEVTAARLAEVRPMALLGVGVAVGRSAAALEQTGRPPRAGAPDVDGQPGEAAHGPPRRSTWAEDLAPHLGVGLSDDAGAYVCNAWLFGALSRWGDLVPVGFLHIPSVGFSPERLAAGLRRWYGGGRPRSNT